MQIAEIETKLGSFDDEVEKIEADQKRLRENIEALSKTPEAKTLITRHISKANDQETQLEDMEKQRKALQAQKEKLSQDLATEIRNFEVKSGKTLRDNGDDLELHGPTTVNLLEQDKTTFATTRPASYRGIY